MGYGGNIIAHQVNCMGVMNAGLAKLIRGNFPTVYSEYKELCDMDSNTRKVVLGKDNLLGECQWVEVGEGSFVCNLFGQYGYGRDKQYTNYDALENSFRSLRKFAEEKNIFEVAMPYGIGCGLAGGDWGEVYRRIEKIFNGFNVKLYKL